MALTSFFLFLLFCNEEALAHLKSDCKVSISRFAMKVSEVRCSLQVDLDLSYHSWDHQHHKCQVFLKKYFSYQLVWKELKILVLTCSLSEPSTSWQNIIKTSEWITGYQYKCTKQQSIRISHPTSLSNWSKHVCWGYPCTSYNLCWAKLKEKICKVTSRDDLYG